MRIFNQTFSILEIRRLEFIASQKLIEAHNITFQGSAVFNKRPYLFSEIWFKLTNWCEPLYNSSLNTRETTGIYIRCQGNARKSNFYSDDIMLIVWIKSSYVKMSIV